MQHTATWLMSLSGLTVTADANGALTYTGTFTDMTNDSTTAIAVSLDGTVQ